MLGAKAESEPNGVQGIGRHRKSRDRRTFEKRIDSKFPLGAVVDFSIPRFIHESGKECIALRFIERNARFQFLDEAVIVGPFASECGVDCVLTLGTDRSSEGAVLRGADGHPNRGWFCGIEENVMGFR